MQLSKNAIGNLINRYKAVLKKCHLLNTFGSLALAGVLALGGLGVLAMPMQAEAAAFEPTLDKEETKTYLKGLKKEDGVTPVYDAAFVDSISSAYSIEVKDPSKTYFKTFTMQENGTEVTYGISIKETPSAQGAGNPYTEIEDVTATITDPVDTTQYTFKIETTDASGTPTTLYFAVKNASGDVLKEIGRVENTSGTELSYNQNFIGNSATGDGGGMYNLTVGGSDMIISAITGDFVGNTATGDGGGMYNRGGDANDTAYVTYGTINIGSITGDFVGNTAGRDGGGMYNWANGKTVSSNETIIITSITGDFVGNTAGRDGGGMSNAVASVLPTTLTIRNIIGDFVGNTAGRDGGGMHNDSRNLGDLTIENLIGDFMGNTAGAHGGALYNELATIENLIGDFVGNRAISDSSFVQGGALYNDGTTIENISGSFIDNFAQTSAAGAVAQGGAIWTNISLNFTADGQAYEMSGNYVSSDGGATKDYNAIYMGANDLSLTFNLKNGGSYTLDDTVIAEKDGYSGAQYTYTFNITGTGTGTNIFNLNNALNNASAVTVNNATLNFGTVTHDKEYSGSIGTATLSVEGTSTLNNVTATGATTITSGTTTLLGTMSFADFTSTGATSLINSGTTTFKGTTTLGTVTNSGSITALNSVAFNEGYESAGTLNIGNASTAGAVTLAANKGMSIQSDGTLNVLNGTLDVSGGTLTVADDATTFATGADGVLKAKASDFGDITEAGGFTLGTNVAKQLTNAGELILTNVGFDSMSKAANLKLQADADWQSLVIGSGDVILQNNGSDISLIGLYSLTYVDESKQLDTENIMAGNLTDPAGTGRTVNAASIVANTDEGGATDSTISGANVNLTLTGRDAGGGTTNTTLAQGDMSVSEDAHLTLGVANSPNQLYFDGDITVDGPNSKLTVNGAVHMSGTDNIYHSVTLTDGADLEVQAGKYINIKSLNRLDPNTSQVNIAGYLLLQDAVSFETSDFATKEENGKIYLAGILITFGTLTLNGGGNLELADGAYITADNGLTLSADTTLTGGKIDLSGQLSGATLTVNNASSTLYINGDASTADTSALTITQGTLHIEAGTLTAGADIDFGSGGTLEIRSGASLDISGDKLTANMKDFGTVTLSDNEYEFKSFSETGATVQANLKADGTTELVFNSEVQGTILLDNYDAMLAALADSIFGVGHTFNTSNLTITGYGQYNSLTNINTATNTPNVDIAAGTYAFDNTSTFAGIVENRNNIKDSIINVNKGELSLSGNNVGRILSTGNITVKDGGLTLGYADDATTGGTVQGNLIVDEIAGGYALAVSRGAQVTVTGTAEIKNGGELWVRSGNFTAEEGISVDGAGSSFRASSDVNTVSLALTNGGAVNIDTGKSINVTSNVELAGDSMSVGSGTLEAAGFTMNKTALTLTGGTLKSTAGISNTAAVTLNGGTITLAGDTWNAGANVAVTSGTLTLASGTSMNMGSNELSSTNGTGTIDMSGAILNLSIANLGAVDLNSSSETFTANNKINGTFTSTADSVLSIAGLSGTLNELTFTSLKDEIKNEAFDSTYLGSINFEDIEVDTVSLSGVMKDWNTPAVPLMAGNLDYKGTTTISHLIENTYDTAIGKNSTIIGSGVNLVLTGQGGNTTLSEGDMEVSGGASLTLGDSSVREALTFDGNITVTGAGSKLTALGGDEESITLGAGASDKTISLTNGGVFAVEGVNVFANDVTFDNQSQVNVGLQGVDTWLYVQENKTLNVSDFSATSAAGKIAIGDAGQFDTKGTLTLNGGGNLTIAEMGNIGATGFTFGADTTIKAGNLILQYSLDVGTGIITGAKLTIDNVKSNLTIDHENATTTHELAINNGTLELGTNDKLTLGAALTFGAGGTLKMADTSDLDVSGQNLTANVKDFGAVTLDDNKYNFVSFNEGNASVEANLTGDGATILELNTNASGDPILLDNYNEMLTALAESIFGSGHSFDVSNLTVNGYGQYNTLTNISVATNTPDEVVAAGNYTFSGKSTFAGITKDRSGNVDSTINGDGAVVNLSGNGGFDLSAGSITVNNGELGLGWDVIGKTDGGTVKGDIIIDQASGKTAEVYAYGTKVIVEGITEVKNGGTFQVTRDSILEVQGGISIDASSHFFAYGDVTTTGLSMASGADIEISSGKTVSVTNAVNLVGGFMNVGAGTLEAAGFTNTTADLTLTDGTLKTTNGMTTDKNLTITNATFNLAGGNMDVSGVVFTAGAAASLLTAEGTTLTAGIGTIGVDANAEASGTASVVWDASDSINGNVVIDGLATREFDLSIASDLTAFDALSDAAKTAYGDAVKLSFNNISYSGVNLTIVGDNALVGFADTTVSLGSGLKDNTSAIVGAVSGGDGTTPLTMGTGSNLTITGNSVGDNDGWLYNGPINVTAGSDLTLGMGNVVSVTNSGSTTLTGGTQITGELLLNAGSVLNVEGTNNNVGTLQTTAAISFYVGDSTSTIPAGITVANVNFADGTLAMHDPAWVAGASIAGASYGVYQKFVDDKVNAHLISGQNSYVVIGNATSAWAQEAFNNSGLTWGQSDITAALFVKNPHTLTAGSLVVDGSLTALPGILSAKTATFADNSLLVVDANGVGNTAALTAEGSSGNLVVGNTAKLLIVGGSDGQELTVVDGFTDIVSVNGTSTGWDIDQAGAAEVKAENIHFDNSLFFAESIAVDGTDGSYKLTLGVKYVDNPYVSDSTNARYEEAANKYGGGNVGDTDPVSRYIAKLSSDSYNGNASDKQKDAATIKYDNPAAAIAVAKSTMNVATNAGGAVNLRNSLLGLKSGEGNFAATTLSDGQVTGEVSKNSGSMQKNMAEKSGVGVWLSPLFKWTSTSGMKVSNGLEGDYETGLGGIAVGVDYTHKLDRDAALRFGLALNVGAGYTEGSGDLSGLENDFDFWGLNLYTAFQKENFVATLDVGYSGITNEIAYKGLGNVGSSSADVYSSVWSVGLNLEYTFETEFMNITPHAGVRYMSIYTEDYKVKGENSALVEEDYQDVWYFPVGVTFSKDIVTESGWTFTPKLDVGFIAAAGDLDATSKARFPNGTITSTETFQVIDGFAFNGGLGFDLVNEESGVSLGLNYNIQASEHETGHTINAVFKYEF